MRFSLSRKSKRQVSVLSASCSFIFREGVASDFEVDTRESFQVVYTKPSDGVFVRANGATSRGSARAKRQVTPQGLRSFRFYFGGLVLDAGRFLTFFAIIAEGGKEALPRLNIIYQRCPDVVLPWRCTNPRSSPSPVPAPQRLPPYLPHVRAPRAAGPHPLRGLRCVPLPLARAFFLVYRANRTQNPLPSRLCAKRKVLSGAQTISKQFKFKLLPPLSSHGIARFLLNRRNIASQDHCGHAEMLRLIISRSGAGVSGLPAQSPVPS